jgi:hypothetical protein
LKDSLGASGKFVAELGDEIVFYSNDRSFTCILRVQIYEEKDVFNQKGGFKVKKS